MIEAIFNILNSPRTGLLTTPLIRMKKKITLSFQASYVNFEVNE